MLVNLADWCFRRRRLVVVAWLGALAASFLLAGAFGGDFRQDYLQPGSESRAAADTLEESFPQRAGDTVQIVLHASRRDLARGAGPGRGALRRRRRNDHVVGIASPFAADGAAQVSEDGTTAYADVALDMTVNEYTPAQAAALVEPILAAADDTLQVEVGGPVAALSQAAPVGSEGHRARRCRRHPAVTFGSVVAMGLPLHHRAVRARDRHGARGGAAARGRRPRLGARDRRHGRHRRRHRLRAAHRHPLPHQPRRRAGPAAGDLHRDRDGRPRRAVRRVTVVVSMLGILLMGQPAMTGFAFTVVLAVLVTVAASLTLAAGHPRLHRAWHRTPARPVRQQARHAPTTPRGGSAGAVSSSAAPGSPRSADWLCSWRSPHRSSASASASPTPRTTPPTSTTRQAYDLLADGFGPGFSAPLVLTVQGPNGDLPAAAAALGDTLSRVDGVAHVAPGRRERRG